MRIHFANQYGEVYAEASAVRVENGTLVPDSLGLPPVTVVDDDDYPDCTDDCGWCQHPCWHD